MKLIQKGPNRSSKCEYYIIHWCVLGCFCLSIFLLCCCCLWGHVKLSNIYLTGQGGGGEGGRQIYSNTLQGITNYFIWHSWVYKYVVIRSHDLMWCTVETSMTYVKLLQRNVWPSYRLYRGRHRTLRSRPYLLCVVTVWVFILCS